MTRIEFNPAPPEFAAEYIRLRAQTRENAVTEERLRASGVTAESWTRDIRSGKIEGYVAQSDQKKVIAYCFGNTHTAEVVVLAVLPAFECQGIGQRLLNLVADQLRQHGHTRLFLGCSPDPTARSYGFYRHQGWRSTGTFDERGDEVLELLKP